MKMGDYTCRCVSCGSQFVGLKRRTQCKVCYITSLTADRDRLEDRVNSLRLTLDERCLDYSRWKALAVEALAIIKDAKSGMMDGMSSYKWHEAFGVLDKGYVRLQEAMNGG